jgi:hypothetical protein
VSSTGSTINPLAAYEIYQGATSGNPVGQTQAGLQAAKLYGNLSGNSALNSGATGALDALGMYQGIQQGGWQGDTRAAASGLQLAGLASGNSALSTAGGGLLIPLDLYNEINNYQSGNTASDAEAGATTGAAIGSVVPVVGTVIGGLAGGALGALASAFGPGEKDPETTDVQNVINAVSSNQNNPNVAAEAQDPYLQLAGLMDERSSTLPEYQQYGRMGEQQFTDAMVNQINQAVTANPSLANNPNAVYSQVVAPWVNSMGSGYNNVGQAYTATNEGLIDDMVNQYMSGNAATDWQSVGGQSPFANVYNNSPFEPQYQDVEAQQAAQANAEMNAQQLKEDSGQKAGMAKVARGGSMKKAHKRSSVLDRIRPSFKDVPRHFDTGGSNYYGLYFNPTTYGSENSFNLSTPSNEGLSGLGTDYNSQQAVDSINNPYANNTASSGSSSGLGGILSSLGLGSVGSAIKNYGALAPLIAAALGGNKAATAPATPAGFTSGTSTSLPTATNTRTYTQPNVQNWYTYGEGPEQSFYSNNQIPYVQGFSPTNQAPATTAPATSNTQPSLQGGMQSTLARGGMFDSSQGDSYVPDPGHGDGTSDDVDAKLSGGEYVMDGGTVSMLGNGSNEAGARALDQLRQRIRKHAGKQLVKGKQFMKAKAPEAYLRGGKAS